MRRLPKQTGARVRAKHRRPKGQEATETQPGCVTFLTLAKILPAFPEFGRFGNPNLGRRMRSGKAVCSAGGPGWSNLFAVRVTKSRVSCATQRGRPPRCIGSMFSNGGREWRSADEPRESRQPYSPSGTLTRCGLFACQSAICLATSNAPRTLSCAVPACSARFAHRTTTLGARTS